MKKKNNGAELTGVEKVIMDRLKVSFEKAMEEGIMPWQRGWRQSLPISYNTGKSYKGINLILLQKPGEYVTKRKAKELGKIKEGAQEECVIYSLDRNKKNRELVEKKYGEAKRLGKTAEVEELKKQLKRLAPRYVKRYTTVYHISDTEGIPSKLPVIEAVDTPFKKVPEAETFIENWPVPIDYGYNRAAYSPSKDVIMLPDRKSFYSVAEFYGTALHEIGHSTGHPSRLDREIFNFKGDKKYSYEELVAEIFAMYMRAEFGVIGEKADLNSEAYIQGWVKFIGNKWEIVHAALYDALRAKHYALENAVINEKEEVA